MTVKTVTANDFETQALGSELPAIVLFSTPDKKYSDYMKKSLEAAAEAKGGQINFFEKTFEQDGRIEKEPTYDVQSAPTTLLFKNGTLQRTVVGFYPYEGEFKTWVDELSNA